MGSLQGTNSCVSQCRVACHQNEGHPSFSPCSCCPTGHLTSLNVMGLLVSISQRLAPLDYRVYNADPKAFNPLENIPLPEQWALDGRSCLFLWGIWVLQEPVIVLEINTNSISHVLGSSCCKQQFLHFGEVETLETQPLCVCVSLCVY